MARLINSLLLIALLLIAAASLSNCQVVQVTGSSLTCSNPSPLLNRPVLSGAIVTLSCDGGLTAINSTVTNASGDFSIAVSNAISVPRVFPTNCRVFVTLPTSCTVIRLSGRVITLRSLAIVRVLGQVGLFRVTLFVADN